VAKRSGFILLLLRICLLTMPTFCVLNAHAQDSLKADWLRKQQPDNLPDSAKRADTLVMRQQRQTDSIVVSPEPHSPRKAAFYSAVLPGLGQAYNREYWKIPLVAVALGTSTYFFVDNFKTYIDFRDAYRIRMDGNQQTVDKYVNLYSDLGLKANRDAFRQYVDYSVLVFILAYGLNIVDATVFAHLRNFDMSDDLSAKVRPAIINNNSIGFSLKINLGKRNKSYQPLAISKY
jgi:hypothetical protein